MRLLEGGAFRLHKGELRVKRRAFRGQEGGGAINKNSFLECMERLGNGVHLIQAGEPTPTNQRAKRQRGGMPARRRRKNGSVATAWDVNKEGDIGKTRMSPL